MQNHKCSCLYPQRLREPLRAAQAAKAEWRVGDGEPVQPADEVREEQEEQPELGHGGGVGGRARKGGRGGRRHLPAAAAGDRRRRRRSADVRRLGAGE